MKILSKYDFNENLKAKTSLLTKLVIKRQENLSTSLDKTKQPIV